MYAYESQSASASAAVLYYLKKKGNVILGDMEILLCLMSNRMVSTRADSERE